MISDERGLPLSIDNAEAASLFDRTVEHYLKFHADLPALLGQMLAADPNFLMGLCFKGYLLLSASNPAFAGEIATTLAAAEAGAAGATERERQHLAAFAAWAGGALDRSFGIWRQLLDAHPNDLLAVRICDTSWFRHGQTAKILEQADRLAPRWSPELPGYDLFRTIWAFAHEEAGDTAGAERAIDEVIEEDRTNYFAHHVKAHVLEMECRPREGRDWLASQTAHWLLGNQLIHHLWWHRALMELELGELDAVLESYDREIRNLDEPMTKATPDHFIDLQNAPAVLWRLERMGVDVGDRWRELADKAEARIGHVGHPLLVELLAPRREQIRLLGGSNAQRDLFTQMLVDAAMKMSRRDIVAEVIGYETRTRALPPAARAGYAAAARWLI
jgi:tetratricopeptide (TPR) repeat protein